ncbi:DUF2213 domain-containing protein [Pseudomonas sp. NPDC098747]|uniref:DUF2213 domain-containing protein n=1 Tax=Pseudomonas sp. NPDC098747 TaxID=3364487 RepID=UPI00383ABE52
MNKAILANDSARRTDENGFLHVEVSALTKATVNPYYGREIPEWESLDLEPDRIYQVLRPADELEKAVSTFNGLPILIKHKEDSAFDPQKALRVGTTGTSAAWEDPYIVNAIVFHDATAIALIESNKQKELSAGYRYDAVIEKGTFEGQAYELRMKNIRGNHVALVEEGRAGSDVVVADSNPFLRGVMMSVKDKALALAKLLSGKGLLAKDEAITADEIEKALDAEEKPKDEPAGDQDPIAILTAEIEKLKQQLASLAPSEPAEDIANDEDPANPPKKEPMASDKKLQVTPKKETPVIAVDEKKITANVMAHFRDKEVAAEEVRPLVGPVTVSAFDSAGGIYAFALEQKGMNPKDYPAESHKSMVAVLNNQRQPPLIAQDAKPSGVLADIDLGRFH